jgi:hypothetical protein
MKDIEMSKETIIPEAEESEYCAVINLYQEKLKNFENTLDFYEQKNFKAELSQDNFLSLRV